MNTAVTASIGRLCGLKQIEHFRDRLMYVALSVELLKSLVEFPCPKCAYPIQVEIADVVAQAYRWCPGCHRRVKLVDADGSLFASLREVDAAVAALRRAFSS